MKLGPGHKVFIYIYLTLQVSGMSCIASQKNVRQRNVW